jgi:hypothetical protein
VIDIEVKSTVHIMNREEVRQNLFFRRLSSTGESLDTVEPNFSNQAGTADLVQKSLNDGEKCNIKGKIDLNRVIYL